MIDLMKHLYLVQTISTFTHQYIIEAECAEYANDDVTMESTPNSESLTELNQEYLGETIISTREVTHEEVERFCVDAVNGHLGDGVINR
jgi:hypothetical protein